MTMSVVDWQLPSVLRSVRVAFCGFSAGLSLSAANIGRANALDLGSSDGLITETVASRDRLRGWDNVKIYGAERVGERSRKDFQPEGLRVGNYFIYPSLGAAVTFDNNIFATSNIRTADIRTELTPTITFYSELPRHVLNFSLGGRVVTFARHSDQDFADVHAAISGGLHLDSAHTLAGSVLTSLEHEERQDATSARDAAQPLEIVHNRAAGGITRDAGRLYATLSGIFQQWKYGSVRTTDGKLLDESYRDLAALSGQFQGGYRISPGFDSVARLRYSRFLNDGEGGLSHTGNGYDALGGLSFQMNALVRLNLMGGWGLRSYEENGLANIESWLAEGDLSWLLTQNITLYGTLSRGITDQLAADGGSLIATGATARLEYELQRNLVLKLGGGMTENRFQGSPRTDRVYSAKVGIDYYTSKNWLFTFEYEHQSRDSSDPIFDMKRDRFTVDAKLRF